MGMLQSYKQLYPQQHSYLATFFIIFCRLLFLVSAMNATSPKSSLVKLGLHTNKQKTLKVMVLGQSGVGKTGEFSAHLRINEGNPT